MSVVRDLILQADDQLRYPTGGELRSMVDFLSGGARRLGVVRVLTENEKKIVDEAARQLFLRSSLLRSLYVSNMSVGVSIWCGIHRSLPITSQLRSCQLYNR